MTKLFTVTDLNGKSIYLTSERWQHIQKHGKNAGTIEEIITTLQYPDIITQSDQGTYLYYTYSKQRKMHLFISVKYLNGGGFIITSFYTRKRS